MQGKEFIAFLLLFLAVGFSGYGLLTRCPDLECGSCDCPEIPKCPDCSCPVSTEISECPDCVCYTDKECSKVLKIYKESCVLPVEPCVSGKTKLEPTRATKTECWFKCPEDMSYCEYKIVATRGSKTGRIESGHSSSMSGDRKSVV